MLLQLGRVHLLQLLYVVETLLKDTVHILAYHVLNLIVLPKQLVLADIELVELAHLVHELEVRSWLHGVRALHYLQLLEVSSNLSKISAL